MKLKKPTWAADYVRITPTTVPGQYYLHEAIKLAYKEDCSLRREDWANDTYVSFINDNDVPIIHNVRRGVIATFAPSYSDYLHDGWTLHEKPDLSKFKLGTFRGGE